MKLVFPSKNGKEFLPKERTFLLFIDETGGQDLLDPNFPIFGFGGVGIPASLYVSNIVDPWMNIKKMAFGGEQTQMHAADLRAPNSQQLRLLSGFFNNCAFCRIACVVSDKTSIGNKSESDLYNLVVSTFYSRLHEVLNETDFDNIFMVFEDSQRDNHKNRDYFNRYKIERRNGGNKSIVQCDKFIMSKTEREPGLEVADFVAHTAGSSVLSRLRGKRSATNERRDFDAVFNSQFKRISSFIEITKVK
jgi:hypothetical protein